MEDTCFLTVKLVQESALPNWNDIAVIADFSKGYHASLIII